MERAWEPAVEDAPVVIVADVRGHPCLRNGALLRARSGSNAADIVWREIATVAAPDDPPPTRQQ